MIWVLAVVVVGLIAVLAELLLSFQKKADDLRHIQNPIRRRIREHQEAMQQAVSTIETAANGQVQELDAKMPVYTQQLSGLGQQLSEIEKRVFGPDYDPTVPVAVEEEDFLAKANKIEDEKEQAEVDPSEKVARAGRDLLDDLEGHKTSLQRDIEVVKRTAALLEGKLKRGSS